jgi:hypothetical protein
MRFALSKEQQRRQKRRKWRVLIFLLLPRLAPDFKYESKNYKTKLAHFVMKVNYSAN